MASEIWTISVFPAIPNPSRTFYTSHDPSGRTHCPRNVCVRIVVHVDDDNCKERTQMAAKEVKFSVEARDKMLRGVDILANAVSGYLERGDRPGGQDLGQW